jgi:cell division transport system permease protein
VKRFVYLLREALTSLRANRTSTLVGVLTTGFTITSFGIFLLLYLNVQKAVGTLQDHIQLIVYLQDDFSSEEKGQLERWLKQEPTVEDLSFISKKQALEDFHHQFPGESFLLDGIGGNPLPASFVATLSSNSNSATVVSNLATQVQELPGVERVRYSREWVERLTLFVSYLELGAVIIGLILCLASVTIISNTVRLAFYLRREEIEILRLIGATGTFIAIPYVIEGAILGIVGGGLSVGLLRGMFEVFQQKIAGLGLIGGFPSGLEFFPVQTSLTLVIAGMMLGCTASILSVYSWIRVRS